MRGRETSNSKRVTLLMKLGILGALLLLISLVLIVPTASTKTQAHFVNCASGTGNNETVGITVDAVEPGSFTPQSGDEIAVFQPDGSLCVGTVLYSSEGTKVITVWGDNSGTGGVVDGIQNGEIMQWRIWDSSVNREYFANVVYNKTYSNNTIGAYVTDGIFLLDSLKPSDPTTSNTPTNTATPSRTPTATNTPGGPAATSTPDPIDTGNYLPVIMNDHG